VTYYLSISSCRSTVFSKPVEKKYVSKNSKYKKDFSKCKQSCTITKTEVLLPNIVGHYFQSFEAKGMYMGGDPDHLRLGLPSGYNFVRQQNIINLSEEKWWENRAEMIGPTSNLGEGTGHRRRKWGGGNQASANHNFWKINQIKKIEGNMSNIEEFYLLGYNAV
jgi:hypothetical protein